jgi:hypothetical protein
MDWKVMTILLLLAYILLISTGVVTFNPPWDMPPDQDLGRVCTSGGVPGRAVIHGYWWWRRELCKIK